MGKNDFSDNIQNMVKMELIRKGKVRDIYRYSDRKLVLVATDRISAFDFVLPTEIPDKGKILTKMSVLWFQRFPEVENHLIEWRWEKVPGLPEEFKERFMLVHEAEPIPVEFIVRGYLAGSGWREYKRTGKLFGQDVGEGLRESDRLPRPVFTPTTKAMEGHDMPISLEEYREIVGPHADYLMEVSLSIYQKAHDYALGKGIIIADTKFEFGLLDGKPILIDELLTPDSSRFWPAEEYEPGKPQRSFDKQYVRDYLLSTDWDRKSTPPPLPPEVVKKTQEKYREALRRLFGEEG